MFVVDTNILLYAVNPDSPDHGQAHQLLDDWRKGDRAWFLTWALMREHGVSEIRTADMDFHQFKFIDVTNPLT